MDMSRLRFFPSYRLSIIFAVLNCLSFPAFSISPVFSYVEFNIAFALGLSLPVIVMVALIRPKLTFDWLFPILLTLCLLGILSSIAYLITNQILVLLTCAASFLSLIYFWFVSVNVELKTKVVSVSNTLVALFSITYLMILWFFNNVDAHLAWGIFSSVIFILASLHTIKAVKQSKLLLSKLLGKLLIIFVFSISVYLWTNTYIGLNWFLNVSVVCYFIVILNFFHSMVRNILNQTGNGISNQTEELNPLISYPNDPATNLPNYQQALKKIEYALKEDNEMRCVVIVIKPINFQQVNTVLGHHNSDILLSQLAYCLQKAVTNTNELINFNVIDPPVRIARLQGLHFLVVMNVAASHHPKKMIIEELCHKLTMAVPEAMSFKSFSLNFELAFGVAFIGEHGNSVSEVIAHAEDALLNAESSHKKLSYFDNEAVLYTEQHLLKMDRLKQDIRNENLCWFLQPQVRLSDKRIIGFELMVHWYNESEDPLELHQFIDTAEYSGEIYLLTKQMISQAFKVLVKLRMLSKNETISIKLLSSYLLETNLVHFIEQQIEEYDVPGSYLIIELTEDVVLSASKRAKEIIDQLKSLKVKIAIADFSGSYESLRYIRKMAVNQIKIDCHRLTESSGNSSDKAIVNALVNLTRSMKLPLIGTEINDEGIERSFCFIGGELAQGKIISKGVVPEELEIWLSEWNKLHPS